MMNQLQSLGDIFLEEACDVDTPVVVITETTFMRLLALQQYPLAA